MGNIRRRNRGLEPYGRTIQDRGSTVSWQASNVPSRAPVWRRVAIALILAVLLLSFHAQSVLYAAPGDLDPTFDGDGIVLTNIDGSDIEVASSVALQSDGKIVAAGYSVAGAISRVLLVRYNSDGSHDSTLGGDGIVITDIAGRPSSASSVAIQNDGKIVVAGQTNVSGQGDNILVMRYHADGTLDNSFAGDGIAITDVAGRIDRARSVVIQSDGKILVAGEATLADKDFVVVRYNADGTLDSTFGGDGIVVTDIASAPDSGWSMALQSDGKIVVAGETSTGTGAGDFAVLRYSTDGTLDTTFDGDGIVVTSLTGNNDIANAVALQSDGKIITVGTANVGDDADMAVVRYNADGTLDTTFDGDGIVTTDVSGAKDTASSVVIQSDGKIIAAGKGTTGAGFAVVRYNPDGTLDNTFGGDGIVNTTLGAASDIATSVVVQNDGKIVAAGRGNTGYGTTSVAVVRYEATSNQPPTADAGGPYSGNEGSGILLGDATATDDEGILSIEWTVDSASCSFDDDTVLTPVLTCADNGTFGVTLTVNDGTTAPVSATTTVSVDNVAPDVTALAPATLDPVDIDDQSLVSVEVQFTDPGAQDTHSITVDWGDDAPDAIQTEAASPTSFSHTYSEAGVYAVTASVTDDDNGSASATHQFFVIFDPDGGFVTGGGGFDSQPGAYPEGPSLAGRSNFGFVAKYKKMSDELRGETQFHFREGNLKFHSESYAWLVIAGEKAIYQGTGTLNGSSGYDFLIAATDEKYAAADDTDRFRIVIWEGDTGTVVYDNQPGEALDADPATPLEKGNVSLHQVAAASDVADSSRLIVIGSPPADLLAGLSTEKHSETITTQRYLPIVVR